MSLPRVIPGDWMARAIVWLCMSGLALAFAAEPVTVEQGGIVRWELENCDSCGMNGRTFYPVDGVCYFPVDFAKKPGLYEVAAWRGGQMEKAWVRVVEREFKKEDIEFEDTSYVTLDTETATRHHGEQAQVKPLFRVPVRQPLFQLPLARPTQSMPGGDNFGAHRTFNGEPKSRHTGADYPIALGTPLTAMAKGNVVLVGDHFFSGKSVYMDHGNGLVTMVFHLDSFDTEKGALLETGDAMGKVGSSGRSTGPHLHVGARWHGQRIDPNLLWEDLSGLPSIP